MFLTLAASPEGGSIEPLQGPDGKCTHQRLPDKPAVRPSLRL